MLHPYRRIPPAFKEIIFVVMCFLHKAQLFEHAFAGGVVGVNVGGNGVQVVVCSGLGKEWLQGFGHVAMVPVLRPKFVANFAAAVGVVNVFETGCANKLPRVFQCNTHPKAALQSLQFPPAEHQCFGLAALRKHRCAPPGHHFRRGVKCKNGISISHTQRAEQEVSGLVVEVHVKAKEA